MNLLDIGKKIAGLGLTALGTAVGGPAGAFVGGEVANLLGLSSDATPADIAQKIDADPQAAKLALAKLNAEHEEAMAAYAQQTTALTQTGQTTRTYLASADPYVRRAPATWLYISAAAWALQIIAIIVAIAGATWAALHGQADAAAKLLAGVESLAGALTAQWSVALAVLGVGVVKHSRDKLTDAGKAPPGPLAALIQRLAPHKETAP